MADSSSNTASLLRVTELDFDSIKTNLKTFLKSQSEFADYDFEGSAMNILLDVLAYNTHYMGYYVNMVANEMFLDTAQIRNSVLSHAKLLGYVPRSMTAATARVNVVVTPPPEDVTSSVTINRLTDRFLTEAVDGSTNYNFVTLDNYTATKTGGSFIFNDVVLREGEPVVLTFTHDASTNPKSRYVIPTPTVDTSTIRVIVQESVSSTSSETFTLAADLTDLTADSAVYFLEETESSRYTLTFGDGTFGKSLKTGNIVSISYLDTNASRANRASVFTSAGTIGGFSNVAITTTQIASGGAEKESIEDIKFRAPIHYTTQNRAVTKNDYSLLLKRDYPNIQSLSIWGGEEFDPPQYGKVFISLKPVTGYEFTRPEKQAIVNEIIKNRSVLTVTPEIIDPDLMYLQTKIIVYYDPRKTVRSPSQIQEAVKAVVAQYGSDNLNTFNSVFRGSKLHALIDKADPAITSNDLEIYVQKRTRIINGVKQNYIIDFNTELHRGGLQEKLISYPSVLVLDSSNVQREAFFEEVIDSATGVDFISVISPGSNYSDSPVVTITGDGTGAKASAVVVNGKINSINVDERGTGYSVAFATITDASGTGATTRVGLLGRYGRLRSFYIRADNGEKVILSENAGTIDYNIGRIVLIDLVAFGVGVTPFYGLEPSSFAISVKPVNDTLFPVRNRIITIDENDLTAIEVAVEVDPLVSKLSAPGVV